MAETAELPVLPRTIPPQSPAQKTAAARARWAKVYKVTKPAITQALEIQEALYDASMAMKDDLGSSKDKADRARASQVLSGVAKGWQSIQDQIRILKGKPLPGSLRPQSKPSRKSKPDSVSPMPDTHKESL